MQPSTIIDAICLDKDSLYRGNRLEENATDLAEVMVATVRAQILLSPFTDFENFRTFKPSPRREEELTMIEGFAAIKLGSLHLS